MDERAAIEWPGLARARREAAQAGATSIGTQHVLVALLARDGEAAAALHASGVSPTATTAALQAIIGRGGRSTPVEEQAVRVSARLTHILEQVAAHRGLPGDGFVDDVDVLRALLTSDDPAVGHLVVRIVSNPYRVVRELDRHATTRRAGND